MQQSCPDYQLIITLSGIASSELSLEQVSDHLATGDAGGGPQSREVQGAGESVGVAEEQHGWDPAASVFEGKAGSIHLVLLDLATGQVVNASLRIDLRLVLARDVGKLGALEDVEVVVGGMATGVTFSTDSSAYFVLR